MSCRAIRWAGFASAGSSNGAVAPFQPGDGRRVVRGGSAASLRVPACRNGQGSERLPTVLAMGRNRHGSSRRNRCEVVSTALRSIVPPAAGWQTRTRMFRPGYAMLEVLVAMMAVAIMLGALLSALNHANTQLQSARNQARALALAEERVERFRAQLDRKSVV